MSHELAANTPIYLPRNESANGQTVPLARMGMPWLLAIFAFECFALYSEDKQITGFANALCPALLLAACLVTVAFTVSRNKVVVIFPITWALVSSAFYYGLGPLTYCIGDTYTVAYSHSQYYVTPKALLTTNILNSFFLIIVLASHYCCSQLPVESLRLATARPTSLANLASPRLLALTCILVGGAVRFAFLQPGIKLPGIIGALSPFLEMSLAPLAFLLIRGGFLDRVAYAVVFVGTVALSLLMFQKTAMMQACLFSLIGMGIAGASKNKLAVFALLTLMIYGVSANPIAQLREKRAKRGVVIRGISGNLDLISQAYRQGRLYKSSKERGQGWLLRLNYVPVQAFAINDFDQGRSGDSYKNAFWVLVPRMIYPDKPIMTDVGREFSIRFNGNKFNSTSIGLAGEAYHNGGAIYVAIIGVIVGGVFAGLQKLTLLLLPSVWNFFPCFMIIIYMGTRLDGHFVPDVLGTTAIVIAYVIAARCVQMTWHSKTE